MVEALNPIVDPMTWLYVGIFLAVCYGAFIALKGGKNDDFKMIQLAKIVDTDFNKKITKFGAKVGHRFLRFGVQELGLILSAVVVRYVNPEEIVLKAEQGGVPVDLPPEIKRAVKKKERLPDSHNIDVVKQNTDFYLFKCTGRGILKRFWDIIFGNYTFYLVDQKFIKIQQDVLIKETCEPDYYGGIFIFSQEGYEAVERSAIKYMDEGRLENMVNWLKKMTYLEVRQAKTAELAEILNEGKFITREQFIERGIGSADPKKK